MRLRTTRTILSSSAVAATLLATLAATPSLADEATTASTTTPSISDTARSTPSTSFRLQRLALESVGAVAGELVFLYGSFVILNSMGAFHEQSWRGGVPWAVTLSTSGAAGLGAALGVIAGARILERKPPMLAAAAGGLIGAAWYAGVMAVHHGYQGVFPQAVINVFGLLPAVCAVIASEFAFAQRLPVPPVNVAVAPLIHRGEARGVSLAGVF